MMIRRLGIIGDVHAEDGLLEQALTFLSDAGVDVTLCTGDIVDGSGDVARCVELLSAHQVLTVAGNHDRWLLQNKARHIPEAHRREALAQAALEYLQALPRQRTVQTVKGALLLCHGVGDNDLQKVWPGTERMPAERSTRLDKMIRAGTYRFLVNGHMHYRTLIQFEGLTLFNAGTLKNRHKPGFSIMDIEADEVTGYEFEPTLHRVKTLRLSGDGSETFTDTQAFTGDWTPDTLYA